MSIWTEVLEAIVTKATFPPDSVAAIQATQKLDQLKNSAEADLEEVRFRTNEMVIKAGIAAMDIIGSVPTFVSPALKAVPFIGSALNFAYLTDLAARAKQEQATPPTFSITTETAANLIGATIGLIPGGGLVTASAKLLTGWLGLAYADKYAEISGLIVNGLVADNPMTSEFVLTRLADPTGMAGDQDRKAAYRTLVANLDIPSLVTRASTGDCTAQGLLENALQGGPLDTPLTRPLEYWQQRAQLLLVALKGDLTGDYDGTPTTGPAGIYEGMVGGRYISGYVGIVTPGIGDTYQFGLQGTTAGSVVSDDIYWGTSQSDEYSGLGGDDSIYGFEGSDRLLGGLGNDSIYGGQGDDLLAGEWGADTLVGGADNDTYVVENASDLTLEEQGEGFDTVEIHAGALTNGTYVLQANIEKGLLAEDAGGSGLTGTSADNVLFGNAAANVLTGGSGQDQLFGNAGDDILIGADDVERDLLAGGTGFDTYYAGNNDVVLDADQCGSVNLAGERLSGGVFTGKFGSADVYKDQLSGTTYYYDAAASTLTVVRNGQQLTITNFRNIQDPTGFLSSRGLNLGIKLENGPEQPPAPTQNAVEDGMQAGQAARVVRRDPLLLDLNGDGQISTVPEGSGPRFDFDANGFAESGGWAGAADGLVVRDLNSNGAIDSGRELFGDQTLLPNGTFASNGFQAIAALDSNADGKVDSADAVWSELRVWRDADSDGQTDEGELLSMSDAGVTSISTSFTNTNQTDGSGNTLAQSGSFVRTDGSTGKAGSFLFDRDPMNSLPTEYVDESQAVQALPELDAFGNVYSLRQAMARNPDLEAAVAALVASTDYKSLRAQFDALVQQWTGASSVSPTSRGANMDARQLAVLEAFYGQGFTGADGANPNTSAAPILKDAYTKLVDGLYAQYLAQAQLKSVWEHVDFAANEATGALEADFSGAATAMESLLGAQPSAAVQLLYEFAKSAKQFGLDTSAGFADFKAAFAGSPFGYDQVLQAGLDGATFSVVDATTASTVSEPGFRYVLGSAKVTGSAGSDTLYGGSENNSLDGGLGNDSLYGGTGNDTLDGGYDSDLLEGGDGDDLLGGAAGSADYNHYGYGSFSGYTDAWRAASGGNTYRGGVGNDTLRGTLANDTYLFNLGDGNDTIIEETSGFGGVTDKLVFGSGISAADVSVMRSGNDLVLKLANGTDSIKVQGWFNSTSTLASKLELVQFADGTSWSGAQLSSMALQVAGTAGDDNLTGTNLFANTIDGGDGNDVITGGTVGDTLLGGAGNDTLNGLQGADSLYGGTGNDNLDGGYDSDLLEGGEGDDLLGGASGSADYNHYAYGSFSGYTDAWRAASGGNTYHGGAGSDTLRGTLANDTYLFNLGDGNDTIIEETSGFGGVTDKLVFGSGIAATDVSVTRTGNDLVLKLANGSDSIKVQGWFNSTNVLTGKLELVQFADGASWTGSQLSTMALAVTGTAGDDNLTGTNLFANTIDGGDGNDVITGGTVGDTLLGGAGNDTLNGLQGADSLYGGTGNDTLDGGYDSDLLDGGDGDDLLGGAVGSADYNHYGYGSFSGYTDAWRAASGGNTYRGGAGNDTLRGTLANDTYLFNLGDGNDTIIEEASGFGGVTDKLVFGSGIAAADVSVTRTGNDLVLKLANGTDSIKVQGWFNSTSTLARKLELVQFADGTTWAGAQLSTMALAVSGSAGDDILTGTSLFSNVIDGGDGNDTITGGNVADTLYGGNGTDALNGGLGNDSLYGGTGNDTLDGGYDSDLLDGGDGDDLLGGASGSADYNHYGYGSFSGYTDAWRAASGGNTYRGGAGNDTLRGTLANDTYLFNLGDGNDTIIEETSGFGGVTDKLLLGSGIVAADVSVTRSGNDLVLKLANGSDSIKVQGWFNSTGALAGKLEQVQFADGTVWTGAQLSAMGLAVSGTNGDDSLTGLTSFANTLYGLAGNDTLSGGSLADVLYGGQGNDLLQGGAGDDDYRYFLGDGVDTINDSAGAADILRMDGIDLSSVHYWKQGNDLCIEAAEGQSVLVKNHFLTGNANRIENFYLNGILMSSNDMALMAQPRT